MGLGMFRRHAIEREQKDKEKNVTQLEGEKDAESNNETKNDDKRRRHKR